MPASSQQPASVAIATDHPFPAAQDRRAHGNVHIGESTAASAGWTTVGVMTAVQLQTVRLLLVSARRVPVDFFLKLRALSGGADAQGLVPRCLAASK